MKRIMIAVTTAIILTLLLFGTAFSAPVPPEPVQTVPPVLVWIGLIIGGIAVLGLYFLPTIIAFSRRKNNLTAIFVLNLLAGWSIIGWIFALVWSLTVDK